MNIILNGIDHVAFFLHSNVPRPFKAYQVYRTHGVSYRTALAITKGSRRYWREQGLIVKVIVIWGWLMSELNRRNVTLKSSTGDLDIPYMVLESIDNSNMAKGMLAASLRHGLLAFIHEREEDLAAYLSRSSLIERMTEVDEKWRHGVPFQLSIYGNEATAYPSRVEATNIVYKLEDYL